MAVPTVLSWNQVESWLHGIAELRRVLEEVSLDQEKGFRLPASTALG